MSTDGETTGGWRYPARVNVGGTPAPEPERLGSALLRAHGERLCREVMQAIEEGWPELAVRWGERGREHTREDFYWNLANLDMALATDERTFLAHLGWLRPFLAVRGMPDLLVAPTFVRLRDGIAAIDDPALRDERDRLLAILDAGLATFPPEARVRSPPGTPAGGATT